MYMYTADLLSSEKDMNEPVNGNCSGKVQVLPSEPQKMACDTVEF